MNFVRRASGLYTPESPFPFVAGGAGGLDCSAITETLYPLTDDLDGSWKDAIGGTNIAGYLDNISDTEYIEWVSTSPDDCPIEDDSGLARVNVDNPTGTPDVKECQDLTVRVRCRFTDSDVGCYTFTYGIRQGATTVIASQTLTTGIGTGGFTNHTFTLTAGEYDNITDHTDLRATLQCSYGFTNIFSSTNAAFRVSYIRFEYTPK